MLAAGMNTPARPTDISTIAGKTSAQYDESWSIRVSSSMPTTAIASPGSISALGPTRGSSATRTRR